MNSRIRKAVQSLAAYEPGEQPSEDGFVKLNTNENPYPPSPRVAETLAALDVDRLRKYPDPVSEALRKRIAELHGCHVENVFVGNGSDEGLALCTRAFVEDAGAVGYFSPSYSLYPVLADIRAVEKKPIMLTESFEWPPEFSGTREDFGAPSAQLFFLTNPNAPTGARHPRERIEAFCKAFSGVVVIDEAYVDFAKEDCMDMARDLDNVLVARTLAKAYSLAGLRVGYVVGHASLIEALFKIKDSYNLDVVAQTLALAALSDVEHMQANRDRIIATRERLSRELRDMEYTVYPSETNFLWAMPGRSAAKQVFQRLKEARILTRYFEGERTGAFIRITVGTDAECDKLLNALREIGE